MTGKAEVILKSALIGQRPGCAILFTEVDAQIVGPVASRLGDDLRSRPKPTRSWADLLFPLYAFGRSLHQQRSRTDQSMTIATTQHPWGHAWLSISKQRQSSRRG